ncbi:hypothetical protein GCM10027073_54790 [Streptomyces chlorus]
MPLGAVSETGRSAVWSVQVVTGASNSPGETDGIGVRVDGRFGGSYGREATGPGGARGGGVLPVCPARAA